MFVEIPAINDKELTFATAYLLLEQQAADDAFLYNELHNAVQNTTAVLIVDFSCPNADWNSLTRDQEGNS